VTTILLTGGAGFIGCNLVRHIINETPHRVTILDALTYAGNLENLDDVIDNPRVRFVHGSITDTEKVYDVLSDSSVGAVINLAAESHVDRSIVDARPFIDTNVTGTVVLMDACRAFNVRRFVQVSTDEVYGSLAPHDKPFTEQSPLVPSSPYAASKAAADHLVHAYAHTHGLDTVITRCTNNYGPYQFPEKFIPLVTLCAIDAMPLPIYGDGQQVREWIHVDDHCRGIMAALERGLAGETYNLGGGNEHTNLEIAQKVLEATGRERSLITHVTDRPGHDRRYAVASTKAQRELGWQPQQDFEKGLSATITWYEQHRAWCERISSGEYRNYRNREF
jgi:dTDP-glucose 4,6-dehydratase